jgi:hypothetical protein
MKERFEYEWFLIFRRRERMRAPKENNPQLYIKRR